MVSGRWRRIGEGGNVVGSHFLASAPAQPRGKNEARRGEASFADRINGFGNVLPVFSGTR